MLTASHVSTLMLQIITVVMQKPINEETAQNQTKSHTMQ